MEKTINLQTHDTAMGTKMAVAFAFMANIHSFIHLNMYA